jgi:hypothetical protein
VDEVVEWELAEETELGESPPSATLSTSNLVSPSLGKRQSEPVFLNGWAAAQYRALVLSKNKITGPRSHKGWEPLVWAMARPTKPVFLNRRAAARYRALVL